LRVANTKTITAFPNLGFLVTKWKTFRGFTTGVKTKQFFRVNFILDAPLHEILVCCDGPFLTVREIGFFIGRGVQKIWF